MSSLYFFHLEKIKKQNVFPCKFLKKLKEPSLLCKKCVDQNNFIRTLEIHYKKGWFFHKIFDNSHLKNGKMEKAKIKKNSVFDGPLIINQSLLLSNQIFLILCIFIKRNVWYSRSLKILAIKRWFPFNFTKILQTHHFVVCGPKNFKLYLTFLLLAAFKMLFCRVYCCFRVIVIKLISTIFNEMK